MITRAVPLVICLHQREKPDRRRFAGLPSRSLEASPGHGYRSRRRLVFHRLQGLTRRGLRVDRDRMFDDAGHPLAEHRSIETERVGRYFVRRQ
jgi:hypothetical protein